jgi:hypothetical protein
MSDADKLITVVFEPASRNYTAEIFPFTNAGGNPAPVFTTVVSNAPVSRDCSAHSAYYATITPSSVQAVSGVGTFSSDVTFTFGMLLTVFHD